MEKPTTHSHAVREFFFWSGIVATIAYRIIVIVNNYSQFWAQICWYIGTICFIVYFIHRYQISEKRSKLIAQHNLTDKIAQVEGLSADDKETMAYIFKSLQSSKEKVNYQVIFIASGIALIIGLYLDFLR